MHHDTDFRGAPLPQPDCPAILIKVRISSGVSHNLCRFRVGEVAQDPGIWLRPRFVHTSFRLTDPYYCSAAEIACILLRGFLIWGAAVPRSRGAERDPTLAGPYQRRRSLKQVPGTIMFDRQKCGAGVPPAYGNYNGRGRPLYNFTERGHRGSLRG